MNQTKLCIINIDELEINEDQYDTLYKDIKYLKSQSGKLYNEIKKLKTEESQIREKLDQWYEVSISGKKRKRSLSDDKSSFSEKEINEKDNADNKDSNQSDKKSEDSKNQESSKRIKVSETEEVEQKSSKKLSILEEKLK